MRHREDEIIVEEIASTIKITIKTEKASSLVARSKLPTARRLLAKTIA